MKIHRPSVLVASALLWSCGTKSTIVQPDPNAVDEVRVTPATRTVSVGETVQFSAQAYNSAGAELAGQAVWQTGNATVATVDGLGLATAAGSGTAQITATIDGVAGSASLTVEAIPCATRLDVVLAPGQAATFDGGDCLLLPAGTAGDVYRIAVVRPSMISDSLDVPDVTLEVGAVVTPAAVAARVPPQRATPARVAVAPVTARLDASAILRSLDRLEANRRYHEELRERERELLARGAVALPPPPALAPARQAPAPPPDRRDMYLQLDCTAPAVLKPALLIDYDDRLAIYQDSTEWASTPLTTAMTGPMLQYYADYGEQAVLDYFGTPTDIDSNGRVLVASTPAVPSSGVAAVWSGDFFTPSSCSSSNQGEVIYFRYELFADLVAASNPDYTGLSVMAHEMKHVVSLYNGIVRGALQPTWMEEGRAEIAQTMSSRIAWAATGGPAVGSIITGQAIQASGFTPENWGTVSEVAGVVRALASQPNSVITNPVGRDSGHSFYATSYQFHRFLGDWYGNAATPRADAGLFTALVDEATPSGFNGLQSVLGKSYTALFEEHVVAIALHSEGPTSLPGFTTWDFRSSSEVFSNPNPVGVYPWPVTGDAPDPFGGTYSGTIGPSGMRFHDLVSTGVAGAQLEVMTSGTNVRIIVARLN